VQLPTEGSASTGSEGSTPNSARWGALAGGAGVEDSAGTLPRCGPGVGGSGEAALVLTGALPRNGLVIIECKVRGSYSGRGLCRPAQTAASRGGKRARRQRPHVQQAVRCHTLHGARARGYRPFALSAVVYHLSDPLTRNALASNPCLSPAAQAGKLLSNWRPLVVTDDPALAAELATLHSGGGAEPEEGDWGSEASFPEDKTCDDLVTDLGLWLDYVEVRPGEKGRRR
jgi:hypothetical protein